MNIYIVIPVHNEENFIIQTLNSIVTQSFLPKKIIVVDDHSTDKTFELVTNFSKNFSFINIIQLVSENKHLPGSKIINAFYKGLETLDDNYDIVCKFDADLIFPNNYLETVVNIFNNNPKCGMAGGVLFVQYNNQWNYENISDKDHLRGPIKAYKKACFKSIGGLKRSIGWDTVDLLLAKYNGWDIIINDQLIVKHLKPTGQNYHNDARFKQGETLYMLRYGFLLSFLSAIKISIRKKNILVFLNYLRGYFSGKNKKLPFLVTTEEGKFIRNYRWKKIKKKLSKFQKHFK